MSLLLIDGFETYATADISKYWAVVGSPAINSSGGRRGGGALYSPNDGFTATSVTYIRASNLTSTVFGFSFNYVGMATSAKHICTLYDAASIQCGVALDRGLLFFSNAPAGAVARVGAAAVLYEGTSYYIELKVTVHNSTGSYELRVNGSVVSTGSGIDTAGVSANNYFNSIEFGVNGSPGAFVTYKYDDLYICDLAGSVNNDFLGDCQVDVIRPDGDGNYTQFTPSTGTSHFALVDETTPNTTDYNSDATAGNKDSYTMTALPALSNDVIKGVQVRGAALKSDSGARSLKQGVRSSTTNSLGAAHALGTSQAIYIDVVELDPATAVAWTTAGVNAVEALFETV